MVTTGGWKQCMVPTGGWKPQSYHERVVTTRDNHRMVETMDSLQSEETIKGGNHAW